jgi:hypothetical protein
MPAARDTRFRSESIEVDCKTSVGTLIRLSDPRSLGAQTKWMGFAIGTARGDGG